MEGATIHNEDLSEPRLEELRFTWQGEKMDSWEDFVENVKNVITNTSFQLIYFNGYFNDKITQSNDKVITYNLQDKQEAQSGINSLKSKIELLQSNITIDTLKKLDYQSFYKTLLSMNHFAVESVQSDFSLVNLGKRNTQGSLPSFNEIKNSNNFYTFTFFLDKALEDLNSKDNIKDKEISKEINENFFESLIFDTDVSKPKNIEEYKNLVSQMSKEISELISEESINKNKTELKKPELINDNKIKLNFDFASFPSQINLIKSGKDRFKVIQKTLEQLSSGDFSINKIIKDEKLFKYFHYTLYNLYKHSIRANPSKSETPIQLNGNLFIKNMETIEALLD